MPLAALLSSLLSKGIATEVATSLAGQGVTTALAKEVVNNPELYKRLAEIANQRIASLRKAKKLKQSYAYQDLAKEILRPQKRRSISIISNAGKKYGNMHREDYLGNALSLLKFLNAQSSTLSGLKAILSKKRANFTTQIINNSDFTAEEAEEVFNYLMSLSDREFARLAKLYEPIINRSQYSVGSYEAFNLIGEHILQRVEVGRKTQIKSAGRNILEDIENDQGRQSIMTEDPVKLQTMTTEQLGSQMGITRQVSPIPFHNNSISINMKSISRKSMQGIIDALKKSGSAF